MALHFPHLSLEIFCRGNINQTPLIISDGKGNREHVLLCNHLAWEYGIRPGITVSAAYALGPTLTVQTRNEIAEQEALEHIAAWAIQFTPMVSLVPPNGLVLEIGGSLKLFGGLKDLLARARKGLTELGYDACLAVAPTPLSATWSARAGSKNPATDIRRLRSHLAPLPVRVLNIDAETLEKLYDLGLHCIGDCLRMPRDGFARRFGPQLLLDLDRALGKAPDARQSFAPPPRFVNRLLLPAQVDSCEALLFAVHRLLLELSGFLQAHFGGIQALSLVMRHPKGTSTRVTLDLVAPSRDVRYLQELLKVRLERIKLDQPVEEIHLRAGKILPLPVRDQDLFSERDLSTENKPQGSGTAEWLARQPLSPGQQHQLVERLRARLGNDAVRGICLVPEHRPERTYRSCAPGEIGPELVFGKRPLWLLVEPLRLQVVQGHPWLQGNLNLRAGPERIESGWWDGQDVMRDYFVAENPKGSRFWIFRERRQERRWFLHGIFA